MIVVYCNQAGWLYCLSKMLWNFQTFQTHIKLLIWVCNVCSGTWSQSLEQMWYLCFKSKCLRNAVAVFCWNEESCKCIVQLFWLICMVSFSLKISCNNLYYHVSTIKQQQKENVSMSKFAKNFEIPSPILV